MKKIIFPFYKKDKHGFLANKWWFRTLIVLYILAIIITPFAIWSWHIGSTDWCYDSLLLTDTEAEIFLEGLDSCNQLYIRALYGGIPIAILCTLAIHYFIQIIFFKIIINYIVLGGRK